MSEQTPSPTGASAQHVGEPVFTISGPARAGVHVAIGPFAVAPVPGEMAMADVLPGAMRGPVFTISGPARAADERLRALEERCDALQSQIIGLRRA